MKKLLSSLVLNLDKPAQNVAEMPLYRAHYCSGMLPLMITLLSFQGPPQDRARGQISLLHIDADSVHCVYNSGTVMMKQHARSAAS
jgi:hypothetical protein